LLISGNEQAGLVTSIPTVGLRDNVFPDGSGWVPLRLCQKIVVVAKNIVIGWSGSLLGATEVLNELRSSCYGAEIDRVSLNKILSSTMKELGQLELQLTGFIRDSEGVTGFSVGADEFHDPVIGKISLLGSGSDDFRRLLNAREWRSLVEEAPLGTPQAVIGGAMTIVGQMLTAEDISHGPLVSYYSYCVKLS
jgi:hypothetical protein